MVGQVKISFVEMGRDSHARHAERPIKLCARMKGFAFDSNDFSSWLPAIWRFDRTSLGLEMARAEERGNGGKQPGCSPRGEIAKGRIMFSPCCLLNETIST